MIEAVELVKHLGGNRILDGVSFCAPDGEVTGLLGPNGAGKTTTMRVLSTLLKPDEGTVTIGGIDVAVDPLGVRAIIGLVTEEPGLFDRLTVREQLRFTGRAYGFDGEAVDDRIAIIGDLLELTPLLDRRGGVLSKGNRQKVSLARALVHDPPVLLLDEPTSGLDVVATAGLEDLLASQVVTAGKTVLLSTHRLDEAERLCHRIVGLAEGRVVADGPPEAWLAQSGATTFRGAFVSVFGAATIGNGESRGAVTG